MKKNVKILMAVSGLMLSAILFSACSKDHDNGANIPVAGLMAFNLAPDQDAIGITLSGNSLTGTPMGYTNFTGGYLRIYPGTRNIRAYDYFMGGAITATASTFTPGKYYSLFVVGANKTYTNVVTNDGLDSLKGETGKSYIRYINAIPDSSKLQVSIGAKSSEQAGFTHVSDFTAVDAGQVEITISNGGNIQASRTISTEPLKAYTVLLVGVPGATDTTKSVQIRYIQNGTLTESGEQKTSTSVQVVKSH